MADLTPSSDKATSPTPGTPQTATKAIVAAVVTVALFVLVGFLAASTEFFAEADTTTITLAIIGTALGGGVLTGVGAWATKNRPKGS